VVLVIASNLYYFHDALVAWWKTALFILFTISAIKMRQFSRRRDAVRKLGEDLRDFIKYAHVFSAIPLFWIAPAYQ
jgi:hypothetical protein